MQSFISSHIFLNLVQNDEIWGQVKELQVPRKEEEECEEELLQITFPLVLLIDSFCQQTEIRWSPP